jgi:O-antigen ligase
VTDHLPIVLLAVIGLACSVALLATRSPLLLTLTALAGTSVGLYLADRLGVPPNLIKIYLSAMFAAAFVMLGQVPHFRTELWEYLLLLFFFGRALLDFVRPDFELRFPLGAVGDGVFLTTAYFYFKKAIIARADRAEAVLRAVLYCSTVIAIIGLFEAMMAIDLFAFKESRFLIQDVMTSQEARIRINSIFDAPEYLGATTSLSMYVVILLYWMGRLRRFTMVGILLLLLLATAANLYRGIWVALTAGLVFLFVLRPGQVRSLHLLMRHVLVLLVIVIAAYLAQALLKSTSLYEERITNPENVRARMTLYDALARGVTEHPLLGSGTGTVGEYLAVTPYNTTDLFTPHNGYLAIAYENGVAILLIYLSWFIALLWRVCGANSPAMIVAGAMVTMILVADMTLYFPLSFGYHSLLVVLMAALAIAERDPLVEQEKPALQAASRIAAAPPELRRRYV